MTETEYIHRLTVACPEQLIEAANHLAVAIGEGAGDFNSFGPAGWQNANGDRFSVVSTAATNLLFAYAGSMLQRRDFAPENWSFELATQAQFAVNLWMGPTEQQPNPPLASTAQIVGIVMDNPFAALQAMGLTRIPEESELT